MSHRVEQAEAPSNARAGILVTLGMLCLAVGFYMLVINPSNAPTEIPGVDLGALGRTESQTLSVVSLQKLAIGMASIIAGAVFFTGGVASWRD